MNECSIDTLNAHSLKRRRGSRFIKGPFLLLGSAILYSSLVLMPHWVVLMCSSFSIKSTSTTIKTKPSSSILFTSFQFNRNGTCIDPKFFVTGVGQQQQQQKPKQAYFTMQNVPGDGDCMFLAVALAATQSLPATDTPTNQTLLPAIQTSTVAAHISYNTTNTTALTLRNAVADVLEMQQNGSTSLLLFISHNRTIMSHDLLQQASKELRIVPSEYIHLLRQMGGLYGGGPELTVLCNLYQRPIHIYEIDTDNINVNPDEVTGNDSCCRTSIGNNNCLPIVERGVFGQGVFDRNLVAPSSIEDVRHWDLHILVVDVSMSEKHACVLFPAVASV